MEEGVGDGGAGEVEADDSPAAGVVLAAVDAGPAAYIADGGGGVPLGIPAAVDGVAVF